MSSSATPARLPAALGVIAAVSTSDRESEAEAKLALEEWLGRWAGVGSGSSFTADFGKGRVSVESRLALHRCGAGRAVADTSGQLLDERCTNRHRSLAHAPAVCGLKAGLTEARLDAEGGAVLFGQSFGAAAHPNFGFGTTEPHVSPVDDGVICSTGGGRADLECFEGMGRKVTPILQTAGGEAADEVDVGSVVVRRVAATLGVVCAGRQTAEGYGECHE